MQSGFSGCSVSVRLNTLQVPSQFLFRNLLWRINQEQHFFKQKCASVSEREEFKVTWRVPSWVCEWRTMHVKNGQGKEFKVFKENVPLLSLLPIVLRPEMYFYYFFFCFIILWARNKMPSFMKQLRSLHKELDKRLNFKFNNQRWNTAKEVCGHESNGFQVSSQGAFQQQTNEKNTLWWEENKREL